MMAHRRFVIICDLISFRDWRPLVEEIKRVSMCWFRRRRKRRKNNRKKNIIEWSYYYEIRPVSLQFTWMIIMIMCCVRWILQSTIDSHTKCISEWLSWIEMFSIIFRNNFPLVSSWFQNRLCIIVVSFLSVSMTSV